MTSSTVGVCVCALVCIVALRTTDGASLPAHKQAPDEQLSLSGIIRQLETAVDSLKNYQQSIQQDDAVQSEKTSSTTSDEDDISLKDALEFLISLAKENKQNRRDHDIPFPLRNPGKSLPVNN